MLFYSLFLSLLSSLISFLGSQAIQATTWTILCRRHLHPLLHSTFTLLSLYSHSTSLYYSTLLHSTPLYFTLHYPLYSTLLHSLQYFSLHSPSLVVYPTQTFPYPTQRLRVLLTSSPHHTYIVLFNSRILRRVHCTYLPSVPRFTPAMSEHVHKRTIEIRAPSP